ncbi:antitermination protein, partial [Escherichia coli]
SHPVYLFLREFSLQDFRGGSRRHVQKLVPDLTDYQWYKGYADVIGKLVTKCWQEEAYAEAQLRKVTR